MTACGEKVGTWAGYQRHWRRGEQACPDCLEAHRIKNLEVSRSADPQTRERNLRMKAAYGRALRRLAAEYPERFSELYALERRAAL
ncbi:MAG TPA: hypothetical protein VL652_34890 [Kutzneria sp.]|nr:hypothetical protein [Kutzneria sp.]